MRSIGRGFVLIGLVLLTACGSSVAPESEEKDICVSGTTAIDSAGLAPSYPEIRSTMDQLRDGAPSLLEERIRIKTSLEELIGKRVVNWCAWVSPVSPTEEVIMAWQIKEKEEYTGEFRLYVSTENPAERYPDQYGHIRIHGLTRSQAQMFPSWHDNLTPQPAGQKVVFSGTIIGMIDYDLLEVLLADLALSK